MTVPLPGILPTELDIRVGTNAVDPFTAAADVAAIFDGGGGADALTGSELADVLLGQRGNDTITGNGGDDFLDGGDGADTFNTGLGNDTVLGGRNKDNVGGMAGNDIVDAGDGEDSVIWNDPDGDLVFGGRGNDFLRGGDVAADVIFGGDGDDLIQAVATPDLAVHASDVLFGDAGNDTIVGGNAADTIEGGADDDIMTGAGGADHFVFRAGTPGDDTIVDFDTTADVVELVGFGADFDPLANLSQSTSGPAGTVLDLAEAGQVLFLGKLVADFGAEDFILA